MNVSVYKVSDIKKKNTFGYKELFRFHKKALRNGDHDGTRDEMGDLSGL